MDDSLIHRRRGGGLFGSALSSMRALANGAPAGFVASWFHACLLKKQIMSIRFLAAQFTALSAKVKSTKQRYLSRDWPAPMRAHSRLASMPVRTRSPRLPRVIHMKRSLLRCAIAIGNSAWSTFNARGRTEPELGLRPSGGLDLQVVVVLLFLGRL